MFSIHKSVLLFITIFIFTIAAKAQERVALDEKGEIFVVDKKMDRRYGLFPNYQPFVSAVLLKDDKQGSYILEIHYKEFDTLKRFRKEMNQAEVDTLRANLTGRIKNHRLFGFDESAENVGATSYLLASAITSLGYHGWAIPNATDLQGGGLLAGYMLTSAGTYFLQHSLVNRLNLNYAQGILGSYGQIAGIGMGIALAAGLESGNHQGNLIGGSVGSILGGIGGLLLGKNKLDYADARLVRTVSTFGSGIGFGLGRMAGVQESLFGIGFGIIGGAIVGKHMANNQSYSVGDDIMVSNSFMAFGFAPMLFSGIFDDLETSLIVGGFGGLVGLAAGHILTRDVDFTKGQAHWVSLFTYGGGVAGLVMSLGFAGAIAEEEILFVGPALGMLAGYTFSTIAFRKRLRYKSILSKANIDFNLNPSGFMSLSKPSNNIRTQMNNPMFGLTWSF